MPLVDAGEEKGKHKMGAKQSFEDKGVPKCNLRNEGKNKKVREKQKAES